MAYFTGRDVSVWVVTEHATDGIARRDAANTDTQPMDRLKVYGDVNTVASISNSAIIGSLGNAGEPNWQISDLTGLDVSIASQDEDISYIGLRNVGKIEVKKDTSINLIIHGHTHIYRTEKIGNIKIINPGECAGILKGKNAVGLLKLKDLSFERIFF